MPHTRQDRTATLGATKSTNATSSLSPIGHVILALGPAGPRKTLAAVAHGGPILAISGNGGERTFSGTPGVSVVSCNTAADAATALRSIATGTAVRYRLVVLQGINGWDGDTDTWTILRRAARDVATRGVTVWLSCALTDRWRQATAMERLATDADAACLIPEDGPPTLLQGTLPSWAQHSLGLAP